MSSGENTPRRALLSALSGGPVKFGPYWLESRLAVGGTAEVYVARPIDPAARPRRLIVKRLLPHFSADPEGRTMFEREAALHAAVRHENVVEVYASGCVDEEPWLAMELVDGCDLYRLLRRLSGEARKLSPGLAAFVCCEVLYALDSVHSARDAHGNPLGIVHRDVTPSNIYLSRDGEVKLGDFGIARAAARATVRPQAGPMLKGKFAYLAPEQVAGEPFDHRADLFAMAVVLAEMLLGRPLFAGSGQLAVLLAIRDCRTDGLREVRGALPIGLSAVLDRALAREPAQRFTSAAALADALNPFAAGPRTARPELGAFVRWVQSAPSVEQMNAVRASAGEIRAAVAARDVATEDRSEDTMPVKEHAAEGLRSKTGEYTAIPSRVFLENGRKLGPWSFARLVEAIATGEVGRGDQVDYMGRGATPVEAIEELARFLPARSVTTGRMADIGAPDFVDDMSTRSLVTVLLRVVAAEATGVLFAEGPTEARRLVRHPAAHGEGGRKELYFVGGKLNHVASNNASELLGEWLVRRGTLSREELDFALAVLPRYAGRMGDTLISLGLVGSLDIFSAIRDQGRDRLVDLFRWDTGSCMFYSGQTAPHVEFPLDLDLVPLVIAGLAAALPGDAPSLKWRSRLDDALTPVAKPPPGMRGLRWPPLLEHILLAVGRTKRLRDLLAAVAVGEVSDDDVLRGVEALLLAELVTWT
ncbi:MAG: serine/threonine protein kinase [Myxococcota bacterium]|nr:serine/threonine protein kinase [Myxococcota bacterium]